MTVEDWHDLAGLCLDAARKLDQRVNYTDTNAWRALASKCAEREAALRQGRVMP